MKPFKELRKEAENLACEISYEIDQESDWFREKDRLHNIIGRIEELKILLFETFETRKEEESQ